MAGDILDWLPVVTSAIGGFAAGHFYGRFRSTRDLLGATLYILYKLQRRGAWFSPRDNRVIAVALDHSANTKRG